MRIAVAVQELKGLESPCADCLEASEGWVIAEIENGLLREIRTEPNPFLIEQAEQCAQALGALGLDVVLTAGAGDETCTMLTEAGVTIEGGACGTARRALIEYITGGILGQAVEHAD